MPHARTIGLLLLALGCGSPAPESDDSMNPDFAAAREAMVARQIEARGVRDPLVLAALRRVPRHRFVPPRLADDAYRDSALPVGHGQTISQPYVVGAMTEALELTGSERVLEIGTGSGYQAAVLAEIAAEVYSIEIVEPLAERARALLLDELGYENLHLRTGDGYQGWPEAAPFDAILLTAAPDHVPEPLLEQLAPGGRLVLPVGARDQELVRLRKTGDAVTRERLFFVRFVPMTGEAQR